MNQLTKASTQAHYDIAIIGGGMVGASLAIALVEAARELSLTIGVFEAVPLPENLSGQLPPSYDARSTVLSFGSCKLFEQMGVWDELVAHACGISHIHVSDRGHFGAVHLDAAKERVPALGYVVENRRLGQSLLQALFEASDVVDFNAPAEVVGAKVKAEGMMLQVDVEGEQHSIKAELVVMADGGRSTLREKMGIDYRHADYDQCAIVANVTLDRAHGGKAYERFTATGPMALLPLEKSLLPNEQVHDSGAQGCDDKSDESRRCALIWSLPLEQIDEYLRCPDSDFLQALQQQFGYRAGRFVHVGERHSYPLKLMQAQEQIRDRLVVIGNAAHTLHPIAGQGFNLALRGALSLAEEIIKAAQQGEPIGALSTLKRFEEKRLWDQQKTVGFSDQVTKLFTTDRTEAVVARNLGLFAMDMTPPLKAWFSRSAMGLDVTAPDFSLRADRSR